MGYKPKRELVRLRFAETELEGLEITSRRISVDGLMHMVELADLVENADPKTFGLADARPLLDQVRDLFGRFAAAIVEWNVEDDDDQPVPATLDGLLTLDFEFVMQVIAHWMSAMSQAPPPLPGGSATGSPPAGLDLAGASQSLPS